MYRPRWFRRNQNNHNGLVHCRTIVTEKSVCNIASNPQRKQVEFHCGSDMVGRNTLIVVVTVVTSRDDWNTDCS